MSHQELDEMTTSEAVAAVEAAEPLVLGIDVGTSSARALIYDAHARPIDGLQAQTPYTPDTTADGGVTLDPDELVDRTVEVIDEVMQAARSLSKPIIAVGFSNFWHSLLGVDEAGRALTPVYLWADIRPGRVVPTLRARLDPERVHRQTGAVLHASYWPAKLLWLAEYHRDVFKHVHYWLSFAEYLYLRLFNKRQVSVSMASGTGLLNVHTCCWDEYTLSALPVRTEQLSPLLDEPLRGLQPEFARRWPQLADALWFPGYGDGACSNIGVGAATAEHAVITVGTSAALRVVLPTADIAAPTGLWLYRLDRSRYVMGGALSEGGNLVAWLERTLQLPSLEGTEREIAQRSPDAGHLTVLPFIAGERSPHWATEARAVIAGIDLHTTPIDIVQACLESIAYQFEAIHRSLRSAVPQIHTMIATGGALLRSPGWIQIMANVLDRPIIASHVTESSSRGAAILALEASGALASTGGEQPAGVSRRTEEPAATDIVYMPHSAGRVAYQQAMERQERLYQAVVGRVPL
jgi:gluconokinase